MGGVVKLLQPETWETYFREFLEEKELNGVRKKTLDDYRYYIPRFFAPIKDLSDTERLRKRVKEFFSEKLSPASFNLRRAYLKSFFSFLLSRGAVLENPISFRKRKNGSKPRAVPQEIIEKLLAVPDKKTFCGLRDFTLILLSLDCGLRPSEALQLCPGDINLPGREIHVPPEVAKTKRGRMVPITPTTASWLRKLLDARPREWGENVPVFCSQDGKPLQPRSWSHTLAKYSKKIGYRVRPYDLRHTCSIEFLRNGGNAFALQKLLGHTTLEMTKHYVALAQEDVRKEHAKASMVNALQTKRLRKLD